MLSYVIIFYFFLHFMHSYFVFLNIFILKLNFFPTKFLKFRNDKLYNLKISAKLKKKISPTMQDTLKLKNNGRNLHKTAKVHLAIKMLGIQHKTVFKR